MEFESISLKNLACFIYDTLKSNGINAILVGGACVSIYSQNRYQSYDLDFATYDELKKIEKVLSKLGFKRTGRCFAHDNCPFVVDFVNPPIAVGQESICRFETLKTSSGSLQLLTPTDCVKDRLSSFFHWDDQQALEQALLVAKERVVDLKNITEWAKKEGYQDKLSQFLKNL